MDILRVLSSPDLEVRKKTLQLVLDLVTSRNIHEVRKKLTFVVVNNHSVTTCTEWCQINFQVVAVLKKEVTKTHNDSEQEEIGGYRQVITCMIIYT